MEIRKRVNNYGTCLKTIALIACWIGVFTIYRFILFFTTFYAT